MCEICVPTCEHKQVVARIDNTDFLLKVPSEISQELTDKDPYKTKIVSKDKTKDVILFLIAPKIDEKLCIGCGRCEEVCAYRAISNVIKKSEDIVAGKAENTCFNHIISRSWTIFKMLYLQYALSSNCC